MQIYFSENTPKNKTEVSREELSMKIKGKEVYDHKIYEITDGKRFFKVTETSIDSVINDIFKNSKEILITPDSKTKN